VSIQAWPEGIETVVLGERIAEGSRIIRSWRALRIRD
jgi:hypothetical protein